MKKVAIIGGGLAGLISSIRLARNGVPCTLFEKKTYPFHRVCGEYISNETIPFLQRERLFPEFVPLPSINRFQLSSVSGRSITLPLDLGGFGISRYSFDQFLARLAKESGVKVLENTEVEDVLPKAGQFEILTADQNYKADIVFGSFGKRSKLDIRFHRGFTKKRSPYAGVKYHLRIPHPENLIALHNFNGGYCGISNIEQGMTNLCYLTHRDNLKTFKSIGEMEEKVLFKNPFLKSIFQNGKFLFDKPETINEISFETKEPVVNHILMLGDAAGMITPLCGNGMAMAIRSAKMASDLALRCCTENLPHEWLERRYIQDWEKAFTGRLRVGRMIQHYLFGSEATSNLAINLAIHIKLLAKLVIKNTHGDPF